MRTPYDLIAPRWASARRQGRYRERRHLDRFIALLGPGAHILDLGCGAGVPIARDLLDRGLRVTGVDASREMLRLAGRACPEAELILGDMTRLTLPRRYDGLVAWDSVFHVPRARHAALFADMHRWLRPHAPLLLSLGGSHDEFVAPMFGIDFFFSGHAPAVGLRLLQASGFEILLAEIDDPSSRGHLAVLARRTEPRPMTRAGAGGVRPS